MIYICTNKQKLTERREATNRIGLWVHKIQFFDILRTSVMPEWWRAETRRNHPSGRLKEKADSGISPYPIKYIALGREHATAETHDTYNPPQKA